MKIALILAAVLGITAAQQAARNPFAPQNFNSNQQQFGNTNNRFQNNQQQNSFRNNQFNSQPQNQFGNQQQFGGSQQQFGSNPFSFNRPAPTTTTTTTTTTTQAPTTTNGARLLSLPEAELCASRPKQWQHGNHNYYFSWDQDESLGLFSDDGQPRKVDWLEARNQCRRRCMDAVSMETESEALMVESFLRNRNVTYIWTSGRLCDFKGCEVREDLKPLNVLGWFWSNTNTKMAPTNSTPPGWNHQPWSQTGHTQDPQPDNAEFAINQTPESCLAVLNNIYQDGIKWHDIACYHKKPYICEDSELLLRYIRATVPGIVL